MWTYSRGVDVVRLVFQGHVDAEEALAAGKHLRDDVGEAVVRVVVELQTNDFPRKLAWALMGMVEDAPVADVVVVGATRAARAAFSDVCEALRVPVSAYESVGAWVGEEQRGSTLRPQRITSMATRPGLQPSAP